VAVEMSVSDNFAAEETPSSLGLDLDLDLDCNDRILHVAIITH